MTTKSPSVVLKILEKPGRLKRVLRMKTVSKIGKTPVKIKTKIEKRTSTIRAVSNQLCDLEKIHPVHTHTSMLRCTNTRMSHATQKNHKKWYEKPIERNHRHSMSVFAESHLVSSNVQTCRKYPQVRENARSCECLSRTKKLFATPTQYHQGMTPTFYIY
jgi:hypothetical protein